MVNLYTRKRRMIIGGGFPMVLPRSNQRLSQQGNIDLRSKITSKDAIAAKRRAAEEAARRQREDEARAAAKAAELIRQKELSLRRIRDAELALQRGQVEDSAANAEDSKTLKRLEEELVAEIERLRAEQARKAKAIVDAKAIQDSFIKNSLNPAAQPGSAPIIRIETPQEAAARAAKQQAELEAAAKQKAADQLQESSVGAMAAAAALQQRAIESAMQATLQFSLQYPLYANLAKNETIMKILTKSAAQIAADHTIATDARLTAEGAIGPFKVEVERTEGLVNAGAAEVLKATVSQATSLSELQARLQELSESNAELLQRNATQTARLEFAKQTVQEITPDIPKLNQEIADLQDKLGPINDKIATLKAEYATYWLGGPKRISDQIAALKTEQSTINKEIDRLTNEILTLQSVALQNLAKEGASAMSERAQAIADKQIAEAAAAQTLQLSPLPDRTKLTRVDADVATYTNQHTAAAADVTAISAQLKDAETAVAQLDPPNPAEANAAASADAALHLTTDAARDFIRTTYVEPNTADTARLREIENELNSLIPPDSSSDTTIAQLLATAAAARDSAGAEIKAIEPLLQVAAQNAAAARAAADVAARDASAATAYKTEIQTAIDVGVKQIQSLLAEASHIKDQIAARNAKFELIIAKYEAVSARAKHIAAENALFQLRPPVKTGGAAQITSIIRALAVAKENLATQSAVSGPTAELYRLVGLADANYKLQQIKVKLDQVLEKIKKDVGDVSINSAELAQRLSAFNNAVAELNAARTNLDRAASELSDAQINKERQEEIKARLFQYITNLGERFKIQSDREAQGLLAQRDLEYYTGLAQPSSADAGRQAADYAINAGEARAAAQGAVTRFVNSKAAGAVASARVPPDGSSVAAELVRLESLSPTVVPDPRPGFRNVLAEIVARRGEIAAAEASLGPRPPLGPMPADRMMELQDEISAMQDLRGIEVEWLRGLDPTGAARDVATAGTVLRTKEAEKVALEAAGVTAVVVRSPAAAEAAVRDATQAAGNASTTLAAIRPIVADAQAAAFKAAATFGAVANLITTLDTIRTGIRNMDRSLINIERRIAELDIEAAGINTTEPASLIQSRDRLRLLKNQMAALLTVEPGRDLSAAIKKLGEAFDAAIHTESIRDASRESSDAQRSIFEDALLAKEEAFAALMKATNTLNRGKDTLESLYSVRDLYNTLLSTLTTEVATRERMNALKETLTSVRENAAMAAAAYGSLKGIAASNKATPSEAVLKLAQEAAIRSKAITNLLMNSQVYLALLKTGVNGSDSIVRLVESLNQTLVNPSARLNDVLNRLAREQSQLNNLQTAFGAVRPPEGPMPADPTLLLRDDIAAMQELRGIDVEWLRGLDPDAAAYDVELANQALADRQAAKAALEAGGLPPRTLRDTENDLSAIGDVFGSLEISLQTVAQKIPPSAEVVEAAKAASRAARQAADALRAEAAAAARVAEMARQLLEFEGGNLPEIINKIPPALNRPTNTRLIFNRAWLNRLQTDRDTLLNSIKDVSLRKDAIDLARAFDAYQKALDRVKTNPLDDGPLRDAIKLRDAALNKLRDADPALARELKGIAEERQQALENLKQTYENYLRTIELRRRNFWNAIAKYGVESTRAAEMKLKAAEAEAAKVAAKALANARRLDALSAAERLRIILKARDGAKKSLRELLERRATIETEISKLLAKKQADALEQINRLRQLGGDVMAEILLKKKAIDEANRIIKDLEGRIAIKQRDLDAAIIKYGKDSLVVKQLRDDLEALKKRRDDAKRTLDEMKLKLKNLQDILAELIKLRKDIEDTLRKLKNELASRKPDPTILGRLADVLSGLSGMQLGLLGAAGAGVLGLGYFGLMAATPGFVSPLTTTSSDYSLGYFEGQNAGRQKGSTDGTVTARVDYAKAKAERDAGASSAATASGQAALSDTAQGEVQSAVESRVSGTGEVEEDDVSVVPVEAEGTEGAEGAETEGEEDTSDSTLLQRGGQTAEDDEDEDEETKETKEDEETKDDATEGVPAESPEEEVVEEEEESGAPDTSGLGSAGIQAAAMTPEDILLPDPIPVPDPVIVTGMPPGKSVDYQQGFTAGYISAYPGAFETMYISYFSNPSEQGIGEIPIAPSIPDDLMGSDLSGCTGPTGPTEDGECPIDIDAIGPTGLEIQGPRGATSDSTDDIGDMADVIGPKEDVEVISRPEKKVINKKLTVSSVISEEADIVDPTPFGDGDPVNRVEPTFDDY